MQVAPSAHSSPHSPQFASSSSRSKQPSGHEVSPLVAHVHSPATQLDSSPHSLPHAPQLASSASVSRHASSQHVSPVPQPGLSPHRHMPDEPQCSSAEQPGPVPHRHMLPAEADTHFSFSGQPFSLRPSAPPSSSVSGEQSAAAHSPSSHISLDSQALPHSPQWARSASVSVQKPEQHS